MSTGLIAVLAVVDVAVVAAAAATVEAAVDG